MAEPTTYTVTTQVDIEMLMYKELTEERETPIDGS